jgi:tetratricopeptide (TPR) repeat protein
MRDLIGWTCVIALAIGCGKKKQETENQPAAGPGSAAMAPPATPDAAAAAPTESEYDKHFNAGEKLEDQKKYAEALVEFEAALKAKPDDARALNEVGFNATFAGKLDRAKEAGLAAVAAAKDDKVLHAQALFNLGLAVEKDQPYAAAQLYTASLVGRPNKAVRARLDKLMKNKMAKEQNKDALALLDKVGIQPTKAPLPAPAASSSATPEDQALMTALEKVGVEWESGAGKSVLRVENLECQENHQSKKPSYECTSPKAKGDPAKAIIAALGGKKVAPVKEHGDMVTFKVAMVRCRSFNEGDSGEPDLCEITP